MWGQKGCDCVDPDHMQILVEGLPKYLMSYLSGMMKGRSSRMPWMECCTGAGGVQQNYMQGY